MRATSLHAVVGAALLCAAALAQAALEADAARQYGGEYATACGDPGAARVRVMPDTVVIEADGKRMTGTNAQAAFSYFGNNPPPDYRVALLAEVKGQELTFVVSADKGGLYGKLEGNKQVNQALGKLTRQRFRKCDGGAPVLGKEKAGNKKVESKIAATEPPTGSTTRGGPMDSPADMLKDPDFKRLYLAALGAGRDRWLTTLDGPATPMRTVSVEGAQYRLVSSCKPHDCGDNNMVVIYGAAGGSLYGRIYERGKSTLLGNPTPGISRALTELGAKEWGH